MSHGLVADRLTGDFFQRIDPAVTDTVGELLLLSPEDRLGQEADKGFPEDPFLDGRTGTHLGGGIKSHGHIKEFLVEERHTPLDTPGGQALVGSQAVVKVEFAQFAYGLLVKRSRVGRFMEIEITSKNLVGTLATQDHLDTHTFNYPGQEIHWRRGPNGGHVVSLDMIDHVAYGVETLLDRIIDFMMDGADRIGNFPGRYQVGRAFQADRERVQLRPPSVAAAVVLDAFRRELLGDGRGDRGIESTR